ncbi:MAG: HAD-IIIA family hydrolase [Spartobacteria bacterium]|nr:HAD-IIIA family hydrolase [Spartobacteria bacterium]
MSDRPAVFFDRDGTLMEEVDYCNNPADVRAIAGAAAGLARLREAGWMIVIITNQSGLSSGKITQAQYEAVNAELGRQLDGLIDAVYFCPDASANPTHRRKPGTGMLDEASSDHGIDLARSWMIGDKDIDILCGQNAGCRTILVETGYGKKHLSVGANFIAPDVSAAMEIVLGHLPE